MESSQLSISLSVFIATCLVFTKQVRRWQNPIKKRSGEDDDDDNKKTGSPRLSFEEVLRLRKQFYSSSVSVSYSNSGPLMIMGGSGCELIDHTGKHYLDTRNNVCHVGHQNPRVVAAVMQQVATLNTNSRYLHPNSVLLAQRLIDLCPKPLAKVFFVNSGSEANDLALRLAKAYSGSKNCVFVDNAYHGHSLATLEISPYKFSHSGEYVNDLREKPNGLKSVGEHLYQVPCPDLYRGRNYRVEECCVDRSKQSVEDDFAKDVEDACKYYQERNENVSAFIIEGGMSVGGVILPPPSYLKRCAKAVRDAGGLYISDEVQTGFGRLGSCFWAFEYGNSGVVPDIITVGKAFGNGMPLAAVITTKEVSEAFESMGVEYFNTFGGNPVSCAAGLAVLDEIKNKNLQSHALNVGKYLRNKFLKLKQNLSIVGDIRGSGLFVGIDLVKDQQTLEPATKECSFICTTLKEKHSILTSIDGPNDNVLVVKPPMCFSKEDVDKFVTAFECSAKDLLCVDLTQLSKTPT